MLNAIVLTLCYILIAAGQSIPPLVVSENNRFLQTSDGKPFFWLADTGWLLFKNLDRADAERYLDDRRQKGFNVIQVMVLHTASDRNAYGDPALVDSDPARPASTPGARFECADEYDFWDHVDWVVDAAALREIRVAMVAAWGSIVRNGTLNEQNVVAYTRFLVERYKNKPNIIWVTGGDTYVDRNTEVWRAMGETFRKFDPKHLITFHPFGRTQSSAGFHNEAWLDFNMFQSGHRRYGQDKTPNAKEEDNWRYVREDYAKTPLKPTVDGEPSYEAIPQGLHDWKEPLWSDNDVRRYAYWSVFAGSFGHTYGHAAVMSMRKPSAGRGPYGNQKPWPEGLHDPGAGQMQWLKKLMLSRPYFERVPDQNLIAGESGTRYDYVIGTRGAGYAFVYTYTGRSFDVQMGRIAGNSVNASWFDPRTGKAIPIGAFPNTGIRKFTPPGKPGPGNDWILVLDDSSQKFAVL
jgi:hypothetical protein